MKKSVAILLTILILFSFFQGALRENVVRAAIHPIWSMFHYNVQHTGQCPYNTSSNDGTLKWRYPTGDDVRSSPAIASDGTIYVGSYDHYLYAINPDGTLKWKHQTAGNILSSPAIAGDGTIYVGSYDNYLYAINPNGTIKWEFETGDDVRSSPVIASDGTVYVGSSDNYLYAINSDGTLKWRYLTAGDIFLSSPAIASDGTVYVGSVKYLYAINSDGTLKWRYEAGAYVIYSSPAIASDGTIYVGSYDSYLYAINPNGTLKWKRLTGNVIYSSPAIASDGTIYVGSNDSYLYAINPNGTLKWGYETDYSIYYSSPAISSDGTIYVGSYDNYFYAINPNGTLKWRYKTGFYVYSSPAISSDGTIYVGSYDNYLYAIGSTASSDLNMHITSPEVGATITTPTFAVSGTFEPAALPLSTSYFRLVVTVGVDIHTYNFTASGSPWGPFPVNIADFPGMVVGGSYTATLQASAVGLTIPPYQTGIRTITWNPSNVTSFTLHIPSGWSLVSVPFDTDVSLLSCQFVLYWDGSQWQTATTLYPGVGYLVLNSSTPKDVILTGTQPSSPFTEPCTGSWQLIGNLFVSPCTLSSTSTIQYILYWDGSQWQNADTNNLQPGMGYLVLTSSSGTFTFTLNP